MNSTQAKKLPIEEVLSKMGYTPIRKDKGGVEWVYNSPFRKETIPSFFVNVKKNVWNDFGDMGGNLLDFVMRHENTDFRGALSFLDNLYHKSDFKARRAIKSDFSSRSSSLVETFVLDEILPLKSAILENYLRERAINIPIAKEYLSLVRFHHSQSKTKYWALGIENLSGGYEVRNSNLKAVIGGKDISLIEGLEQKESRGEVKSVAVFEGMTDFLSYLTEKQRKFLSSDVIILNSAKLAEKAKGVIRQKDYQKVYTFFDNDKAGEEAENSFTELENQIVSCKHLYEGFKDYNEYLKSKVQLNR